MFIFFVNFISTKNRTKNQKETNHMLKKIEIKLIIFFITLCKECSYNGYPCKSESDFDEGKCAKCSSKGCNQMGYWASPELEHGSLYLNTQPPLGKEFCLQNYGVILGSGKIEKQNQARGVFTIYLEAPNGQRSTIEYLDNDSKTFKSNSIENRLLSLKTKFDHKIHRVFISYKRTSNWASWWLYDDRWSFSFVEIQDGNDQKTYSFGQSTNFISSGQTVEFYRI